MVLLEKELIILFQKNILTKNLKKEGLINHSYKNFDCKNLSQVLKVFKKKILKD